MRRLTTTPIRPTHLALAALVAGASLLSIACGNKGNKGDEPVATRTKSADAGARIDSGKPGDSKGESVDAGGFDAGETSEPDQDPADAEDAGEPDVSGETEDAGPEEGGVAAPQTDAGANHQGNADAQAPEPASEPEPVSEPETTSEPEPAVAEPEPVPGDEIDDDPEIPEDCTINYRSAAAEYCEVSYRCGTSAEGGTGAGGAMGVGGGGAIPGEPTMAGSMTPAGMTDATGDSASPAGPADATAMTELAVINPDGSVDSTTAAPAGEDPVSVTVPGAVAPAPPPIDPGAPYPGEDNSLRSYCRLVDNGESEVWACDCNAEGSYRSFQAEGLGDADACGFALQFCLDSPEIDFDPEQEVCVDQGSEVWEYGCDAYRECRVPGEYGGVTVYETSFDSVSCYNEGGETAQCYCSNPDRSVEFQLSNASGSADLCETASTVCQSPELSASGELSCEVDSTSANIDAWCRAGIQCSQTVSVEGTDVSLAANQSMYCTPGAEGILDCDCAGLTYQTPYTDFFDGCEEAAITCSDVATTAPPTTGSGGMAGVPPPPMMGIGGATPAGTASAAGGATAAPLPQ